MAPRRASSVLVVGAVLALLATGCTTTSDDGSTPAQLAATRNSPVPSSTVPSSTVPSSTVSSSPAPSSTATPEPAQLPGGGTQIFPAHRLVGFSGAPGSPALGRLTGNLDKATAKLTAAAAAYGDDPAVLPTFELIATVAQSAPGTSGTYASAASDDTVQRYLTATRKAGGVLLLGIQPGTGDFLPAVQHYEKWLREPDVGVALDPEWAISKGQTPGAVFGHTTGAEIDSVSKYLDGLVSSGHLPQKVLVYHQLNASIVTGVGKLEDRDGVAVVQSVDGIGAAADKTGTYQRVIAGKPTFAHAGFKLFYDEDTRAGKLMTPTQVLALKPQPEYVLYE